MIKRKILMSLLSVSSLFAIAASPTFAASTTVSQEVIVPYAEKEVTVTKIYYYGQTPAPYYDYNKDGYIGRIPLYDTNDLGYGNTEAIYKGTVYNH